MILNTQPSFLLLLRLWICLARLFSPSINRAVSSEKREAGKCQHKQLTHTVKTCDIYLLLGEFEKACSILNVKRPSYLKDNHFPHPKKNPQPTLSGF